jgi:hypothetical protein
MNSMSVCAQRGPRELNVRYRSDTRFTINVSSATRNRQHSLSSTEEAHLDEEQEEQRNSNIIKAETPRVPTLLIFIFARGMFLRFWAHGLLDSCPEIQSRAVRQIEKSLGADGQEDEARAEREEVGEQTLLRCPGSPHEEREKRGKHWTDIDINHLGGKLLSESGSKRTKDSPSSCLI